jgi:hypothetical protein
MSNLIKGERMDIDLNYKFVDLSGEETNVHIGEEIGRALCTCGTGDPIVIDNIGRSLFAHKTLRFDNPEHLGLLIRNIIGMPNMQGLKLVTSLKAQALRIIDNAIASSKVDSVEVKDES